MEHITSRLVIVFEEPLWVAYFHRRDNRGTWGARHVFGPEPTGPEIICFISSKLHLLRFLPVALPAEGEPEAGTDHMRTMHDLTELRLPNPKRSKRAIARQKTAGFGVSKARDALKTAYVLHKAELQQTSRATRATERKREFRLRQARKKQKHRGH